MSAHMPFPDSAAHIARSAHSFEQSRVGKQPRLRRIIAVNTAAICGYALIPVLNDWLNSYHDDDFSLVLPFALVLSRELLEALVMVWQPLMLLTFASTVVAIAATFASGRLRRFARLFGSVSRLMAIITLGSLAIAGAMMMLSFIAVLITVLIVLVIVGLGLGSVFLIRLLFGFWE